MNIREAGRVVLLNEEINNLWHQNIHRLFQNGGGWITWNQQWSMPLFSVGFQKCNRIKITSRCFASVQSRIEQKDTWIDVAFLLVKQESSRNKPLSAKDKRDKVESQRERGAEAPPAKLEQALKKK